jgi:glucose 1-dehydrogenase
VPRVRLLKGLLQYQASYGDGHVIPAAVRVNAVLPGPVDTAAWDAANQKILGTAADVTALGILETPEEVASALTFLASPDATFITGASMVVDGGWSITNDSP